jgi:hypothetical protein
VTSVSSSIIHPDHSNPGNYSNCSNPSIHSNHSNRIYRRACEDRDRNAENRNPTANALFLANLKVQIRADATDERHGYGRDGDGG